ncbi:HAMP domain-containing histidine kinase [Corallococcus exiguus]|uniref:sensor histidine kinase n=1 Tax=Corallococcus TaxID=83461 RepID=UPI000EA342F9|nr:MULTISPECIES: HAMP domain-containing sensor histidine kinase [unclassified Corallococcus]NRD61952.1 HAMP domain-containing histidine kinase [Corallococcus exiguus]RKH30551.1 sensor histidine kinase [Corallococcus sp. CA041A]RKI17577.1 sensor histidine kinase [Corallococcus sp. AB030]
MTSPTSSAWDDANADVWARRRVRRRTYWWCALIIALGSLAHPLVLGGFRADYLLVNLGWTVSFLVLGTAVGAGWLRPPFSGITAGVVSLTSLAVCIQLTGGLSSPLFPSFYTVPLFVAVFVPGQRLPVWSAMAGTLVAVLLMMWLAHAPWMAFVSQCISLLFVFAVSAHGAEAFRKLRAAERNAHLERVEALRQLAESESRRVRVERQRAEVERLVVVGQLAAGVAHEVNNPLAYVKSNLHYLQEEWAHGSPDDLEDVLRVLDETQQGVLRIQQIVTDLRLFSREAPDELESCDVAQALAEAQRLASVRLRSLGVVERDVAQGLSPARVTARHLVQVLVNLLLNSADALEAARSSKPAHVMLRARMEDGRVRVEVEDNGPGIPEAALSRLFEPFFTTKPPGKGTGLGLALCRDYVARAGGTLDAENRAEGGARFILRLPVAGAASPPVHREAPAPVDANAEPAAE